MSARTGAPSPRFLIFCREASSTRQSATAAAAMNASAGSAAIDRGVHLARRLDVNRL